VPAFFVFFSGIGSAAVLALFLTAARPLVSQIPGELAGLFVVLILCGAMSGVTIHSLLRAWSIEYIDAHLEKYGSDKNQLMLQYLAPKGYRDSFL
jgi:hypothetical protein